MIGLSQKEILEVITKYRKEKKEMTITEIYALSQELKWVEEGLLSRKKSCEESIKDTYAYLEKQKTDLMNADAYEGEEAFRASYDWKYEYIEQYKQQINAIDKILADLVKIVLK